MNCNYLKNLSKFLLLTVIIIFNSCTNSTPNNLQEQEIQNQKLIVIKNVNIIPMTIDNKIINGATIVIDNKKIISINESIPNGAKVIDGTGKWLIPGLIDMHVHMQILISEKMHLLKELHFLWILKM